MSFVAVGTREGGNLIRKRALHRQIPACAGMTARFLEISKLYNTNEINPNSNVPGKILCLSWSPDGTYIAAGYQNNIIIVFHVKSKQAVQTLTGHNQYISSLVWTNDSKELISSSRDSTIKIWDISNGELLQTLTNHNGIVYDLDIDRQSSNLVSCSSDSTIIIWELNKPE